MAPNRHTFKQGMEPNELCSLYLADSTKIEFLLSIPMGGLWGNSLAEWQKACLLQSNKSVFKLWICCMLAVTSGKYLTSGVSVSSS